MAACLWKLPGIRTHLVAFDTAVVDLTRDCDDACELLMKVQLGGGTDIGGALRYAAGLIAAPERAIVVLVSDFYEGASEAALVEQVRALSGQRTRVLGLAALDLGGAAGLRPGDGAAARGGRRRDRRDDARRARRLARRRDPGLSGADGPPRPPRPHG